MEWRHRLAGSCGTPAHVRWCGWVGSLQKPEQSTARGSPTHTAGHPHPEVTNQLVGLSLARARVCCSLRRGLAVVSDGLAHAETQTVVWKAVFRGSRLPRSKVRGARCNASR